MIPILYEANVTSFDSFGLGALTDVKSCVCTEERNGAYELTMEYPISGIHYEDLRHSRIILAKANQSQEPQGFRIYKITRPLNGIVTVYAEHVSYQLSYIPSGGFTANSVANTFAGLKNNAYESCPFTFSTNNTTAGTYTQTLPRSIRSSLGGVDGSVLDVFGGEYKWDNFTVYNLSARGSDNGVVLRYGKNITDIKQEENIESTYTGVCPYWTSEESGTVTLPEHVLHASTADNYPFKRTMMLDLTSSFSEKPTEAQLRAAANAYMTVNNIGVPKVSISVSFVQLWQTEEYKDIAPLETVGLCDYVHIYFEKLGVSATAKVVKTEYDTLLDRYNKIELGDAKSTFGDTIINAIQSTSDDKVSFTELENAVQRATNLITGNSGGYVRFVYNSDGQPEEIVVMDTDSIDTAQKVWRWNKSGLGYSSTGYDGTYGLAMTQDGAIVADFITTGTFTASGSGGEFSINADTGLLTWTMTNSEMSSNGTITTKGAVSVGNSIVERTSVLSSGSLKMTMGGEDLVTYSPTNWKGTSTYGGAINTAPNAKFISFGNKESESDPFYLTPLVLNYGLNPNGNTQDVQIYGSARISGETTIRDKIYNSNGDYINALAGGGHYFSSNVSVDGEIIAKDSVGNTGRVMHGIDGNAHEYGVYWNGTTLALVFYVDNTPIGHLNSSGWHWSL
jgi:phage minor structural protein